MSSLWGGLWPCRVAAKSPSWSGALVLGAVQPGPAHKPSPGHGPWHGRVRAEPHAGEPQRFAGLAQPRGRVSVPGRAGPGCQGRGASRGSPLGACGPAGSGAEPAAPCPPGTGPSAPAKPRAAARRAAAGDGAAMGAAAGSWGPLAACLARDRACGAAALGSLAALLWMAAHGL